MFVNRDEMTHITIKLLHHWQSGHIDISVLWAYDLSVGYSPCKDKAGGVFEELHEICRLTFRYLCPTRLSSLSVPAISNTTSKTRVRTTCTIATSPTNDSALLKALVCSVRNFQYQYLFIYCILYTYCPLIVWHRVGVVITTFKALVLF